MPLIGKDGKIHACYRVKGKPKGNLRVVPSAKTRCKRGERKVAWVTAGSSSQSAGGQQGSDGTSGGSGTSGSAGTQGTAGAQGSTATLSTQVGTLNLKLEGLENILKGVTNGDLTGALGKLNGVNNGDLSGVVDTVKGLTNLELTEAVDKLPAVDLLCTQATELTEQENVLRSVFNGLGLEGVLGGLLKVPTLPAALPGFNCPA
ncbi:MAG TPA: hypothetical protein VII45_00305 [Solirubrobacterales bacterium]